MKKQTVLKDIINIIKMSNKADKSFFFLVLLRSLVTASLPFVGIIYSAIIIDSLINGSSLTNIMLYVYQMIIISGFLLISKTLLVFLCEQKSQIINYRLSSEISKKTLSLDYQQLESQYMKDKLSRADQGVNSNGGIGRFIDQLGRSIENFISCIYAFVLMLGIFKTAVINNPSSLEKAFNSPWLGIIIFILIIFGLYFTFTAIKRVNQLNFDFFETNVKTNRVFGYMISASLDYKLSKDVRIYSMDEMLADEQLEFTEKFINSWNKITVEASTKMSKTSLLNNLVLFAAYALIGIKALLGIISVGSVLRLVASITAFNTAVTSFVRYLNQVDILSRYLKLYKEYLDEPTQMYKGTLPIEKREDNDFELEFRNVSFHYPNSEEIILNNVSIKVNVGEKLAIVGPNGAGKTTFIKLLCRLYDPTEGEILLNGIDIRKYDYKEYINLFSVVFQDFKLFSSTIKENVSSGNEASDNEILEYLDRAGVKSIVEKHEAGINTYLYTNFGEKGIEVSGGEAQKIAIARALYKDSPIVILDEPTSALDPISEYEIYTKFDHLVENKTAIYISHRMSSCRFCNNILVIDGGKIVQKGNHEALLQEKEGLYFNMWSAQAKYYNTNEA